MGTIWCFGDSNTYGYDPCGFFGGRYAAPWPDLLAEKTGFRVINDGRNGRMIPVREYELRQFCKDAERYGADALIVMLGTNDLLEGAKAGEAAARMAAFLAGCAVPQILVGLSSILAARGMGARRRSRGGIAGAGAAI